MGILLFSVYQITYLECYAGIVLDHKQNKIKLCNMADEKTKWWLVCSLFSGKDLCTKSIYFFLHKWKILKAHACLKKEMFYLGNNLVIAKPEFLMGLLPASYYSLKMSCFPFGHVKSSPLFWQTDSGPRYSGMKIVLVGKWKISRSDNPWHREEKA